MLTIFLGGLFSFRYKRCRMSFFASQSWPGRGLGSFCAPSDIFKLRESVLVSLNASGSRFGTHWLGDHVRESQLSCAVLFVVEY